MLDFISIFSKGGILLWCFKGAGLLAKEWEAFTPTVNDLIKTVLLQERTSKNNYWESGQLALKYKLDNEFELVFVVAYQKMLPLLYLDKLLDELQLRFRDMFQSELKATRFFGDFSGFAAEYGKAIKIIEHEAKLEEEIKKKPRSYEESDKANKSVASMIKSSKYDTADSKKQQQTKKTAGGKENTRPAAEAAVATAAAAASEDDDDAMDEETLRKNREKLFSGGGKKTPKTPNAAKSPKGTKVGKKSTTWDPVMFGGEGAKINAASLDRTRDKPSDLAANSLADVVDREAVGKSSLLRPLEEEGDDDSDYDEEDEENVGTARSAAAAANSSSRLGGMFSVFRGLVGNKALTKEDLEPAVSKLRDNLIDKNVAAEVANKLCESVSLKLEGSVMGTFQSLTRTVKDALTESLMKLLTPKRRIDIIRDVMEAKANSRPYVMTFCGVNGVGKSTNLAKICFWLIENKFRVLIAACDTFRAGAVEQLRTHTRRLNSLHPPEENGNRDMVQLYEKGYGKDAAGIAMEAINYARDSKIDVVLVDTAGRMQDNEPLMRALTKLISVNAPDLVLFVGEALVGNEAIDQLVKFNAALADHSHQDNPHTIDGIVLTKFDTIDDKVGSAISMTYISGQPIVFVGTGQTYTDLKSLNAKAVVSALMK